MFKKSLLATALLLPLFPAQALVNGTALDQPAFVSLSGFGRSCSGTVLANKWVLTAEHCYMLAGSSVRTIDNQYASVVRLVPHPLASGRYFDMALLELDTALASVYRASATEPQVESLQSLAGYSSEHGGMLQRAQAKAKGPESTGVFEEKGSYELHTDNDNGYSTPGDSGGPCYNADGVWGVIHGKGYCNAIFAEKTKSWLLETINSWSYPTVVKGEGELKIAVQSLHMADELLTPAVQGGLQLVSNSCEVDAVKPFGNCDVVVSGSGQLLIGDGVIEVNKVEAPQPPQPDGGNTGGGDGGGGAAGWLTLLGLGALVARRRRR